MDPITRTRIELAGGYVLDRAAHTLRDAEGRAVELRPQAFDVLCVLAEQRGELVTKDILFARVWPGVVVTDDSLVQAVGDVRRALGEAGRDLVRTVPRRGYLLEPAADGAQQQPPAPPAPLAPPSPPAPPDAAHAAVSAAAARRRWPVVAAVGCLALVLAWASLARDGRSAGAQRATVDRRAALPGADRRG